MPLISVRVPEEDLEFLRARHANISEVVRAALHHEIEMMRFEEAQARLQRVRYVPSRPSEELVREDRDHGH